MKLPWVSRAEYEQALADLATARAAASTWEAAARAHEQNAMTLLGASEKWQDVSGRWEKLFNESCAGRERDMVRGEARHADLLARLTAKPEPVVATAPVIRKEPDEVSKVIREQAEGNVALANHLRRFARKLKDEGKSPDEIIGKLVAWTTTEPAEAAS